VASILVIDTPEGDGNVYLKCFTGGGFVDRIPRSSQRRFYPLLSMSEPVWTWRIGSRMSERNGITIWTMGEGHFVWDGSGYLNDGRPYRSLETARHAADHAMPAHRHEVTHQGRGWACGSLFLELRVEGDIGNAQHLVAFLFEGKPLPRFAVRALRVRGNPVAQRDRQRAKITGSG
jgi:hypothetical protein